MSAELVIPQGIPRQADLSKLSKPKPPILAPNLDSPSAISKIPSQSLNQKKYVGLRKFNSSFATVGSQGSVKLSPKAQFIQQQAALADLPQSHSQIPQSPKGKHRRIPNQSKNYDSKQVCEPNLSDSEPTVSKLMSDSTESFDSASYSQNQEFSPSIPNVENNYPGKPLSKGSSIRKRKVINASSSFSQNDMPKINPSFSMKNFAKIASKSLSSSNDNLIKNQLSFRQNHKGIKSVSSRHSLNLYQNDLIITVQILSNWGNPNTLLLSTVLVMDENKKTIHIKTISSVPDLPNINLLEKLTDQYLVKNENEIFPIDLNFSNNDKFSLIMGLDKLSKPKYVRIWNPSLKDENYLSASAKDVVIYINQKKVTKGEVPQKFGIDIELENEELQQEELRQCESSLLIDELFPTLKPEEKVSDQYGIYPFPKSKIISIEVLATYKKNEQKMNVVGLNGIDFYNDEGVKLSCKDFDSISAKNIIISSYANPRYIVRSSMRTCCMDFQFLGNCTNKAEVEKENGQEKSYSSDNPIFVFTLHEPTTLSMMSIWNFNSIDEGLENGIQKVIIRSNDKIVWSGRVKKGSGLIHGIEKSKTNIWLTDSIPIREQVIQKLSSNVE